MSKKARRNYIRATSQLVNRKKMYKAKKQWIVAGMSFLVAIGLGTVSASTTTHASQVQSNQNQPRTAVIQHQANNMYASIMRANAKSAVANPKSNVASSNSSSMASKSSASNMDVKASSSVTKPVSSVASVTSSSANNGLSKSSTDSVSSVSAKPSLASVSSSAVKPSVSAKSIKSASNESSASQAPKLDMQSSKSSVASSVGVPASSSALSSGLSESSNVSSATKPKVNVSKVSANVKPNLKDNNVVGSKAEPNAQAKNNTNQAKHPIMKVGTVRKQLGDADNIKTGTYKGMNYKYDTNTKALEFTSGTMDSNWNNGFLGSFITHAWIGAPEFMSDATSIKFDDAVDTSKVTDMGHMFTGDSNLQSLDLGNSFDTSNVTNMSDMFTGDRNLQSLNLGNSFDTSKATNMNEMFYEDNALQSLNLGNNFDTSKITNMNAMFNGDNTLQSLNLGNKFNTSNVTTMNSMFDEDSALHSIDLGNNFDTSKVTDMSTMFYGDKALQSLNLGNKFSTSKVTNMWGMLMSNSNLHSLIIDTPLTKLSSDAGLPSMYKETGTNDSSGKPYTLGTANDFSKGNLGTFTPNENIMAYIDIYGASDGLSSDVPQLQNDIPNSNDLGNTWAYVDKTGNISSTPIKDANGDIMIAPKYKGMTYHYNSNTQSLEFVSGIANSDLSYFRGTVPSDVKYAKSIKFDNVNTSKVTNMSDMLGGLRNLHSVDLGNHFDTSNVTDMGGMFWHDKALRSLNLGDKFDTSNVTNMSSMFYGDNALQSLNLGNEFDTSNVTDMNYIFNNDNALQSLTIDTPLTKLNSSTGLPSMYKETGTNDASGKPYTSSTANDFSKGNLGTFVRPANPVPVLHTPLNLVIMNGSKSGSTIQTTVSGTKFDTFNAKSGDIIDGYSVAVPESFNYDTTPHYILVNATEIKKNIPINIHYQIKGHASDVSDITKQVSIDVVSGQTITGQYDESSDIYNSDLDPENYERTGFNDSNIPLKVTTDNINNLATSGIDYNYIATPASPLQITYTDGNRSDINYGQSVGSDTESVSDLTKLLQQQTGKQVPAIVGESVDLTNIIKSNVPKGYHLTSLNSDVNDYRLTASHNGLKLVHLMIGISNPMNNKSLIAKKASESSLANSYAKSADASIATSYKDSVANSVESMDKSIADSTAKSANTSIANSYQNSIAQSVSTANHSLASHDATRADQSITSSYDNSVKASVANQNSNVAKSAMSSADNSISNSYMNSAKQSISTLNKSIANSTQASANNSIKASYENSITNSVNESNVSMASEDAKQADNSIANDYQKSISNSIASLNDSIASSTANSADSSIASSYAESTDNSIANSYKNSVANSVSVANSKLASHDASVADKAIANSEANHKAISSTNNQNSAISSSANETSQSVSFTNDYVPTSNSDTNVDKLVAELEAEPVVSDADSHSKVGFKVEQHIATKPMKHVTRLHDIKVGHIAKYYGMSIKHLRIRKGMKLNKHARIYISIKLKKLASHVSLRHYHIKGAYEIIGKHGKYVRVQIKIGHHIYYVSGKALHHTNHR